MGQQLELINNRYQLLAEIGNGGMGIVYRAHDRLENQLVAVKLLHMATEDLLFPSQHTLSNPQHALINEFKILSGLRHPNIISVYDYGIHQYTPYIVMEYIEDTQTIEHVFKNSTDDEKLKLLTQILDALSYLHRRGIIHRDLKPSNILVAGEQVKVLDFGLSTTIDEAQGRAGTLAYMAPETLQRGETVPQSDLYSFGLIAYQAFTGQLPFDLDDIVEKISEIADMTPLRQYPFDFIIERLLQHDPRDRYPTAQHIRKAYATAMGLPHRESIEIRESYLQSNTFVGRDTELSQLVTALKTALNGRGAMWLIGGESGVGKSRLFEEFRTHALIHSATVLHGQALEDSYTPFHIWRDLIRRLMLSVTISELEASILKELVPDMDTLIGRSIAPAPTVQGDAAKLRLTTTIVELIRRHNTPTVILLEDLQWALDDLDILKHLLRDIEQLPLLIVGNYRIDETPKLPEDFPESTSIQLERLSDDAIAELSASILGKTGKDPGLLSFLQKETEGNAFFMVEVIRALAEDAGTLNAVGQMTLPPEIYTGGIQHVIDRRLALVGDEYQPLLQIAAMYGRYLNLEILTALARDLNIRLDKMLMACADASVLEVVDDDWRFQHDKLRESVLKSITNDDCTKFNQHIASTIEVLYPDDDTYNLRLIHLWHEAHNPDKELFYLLKEGKRHNENAGLRNAIVAEDLFSRANRLSAQLELTSSQELAIAIGLGVALIGQHQADDAAPHFERATQLSLQLNEPSQAAIAMVGYARTRMNTMSQGEILQLLADAVELAYQGGDYKTVVASHSVEGYIHAHYNDFDNALGAFFKARDALTIDYVDYEVAQILNNIGKILQIQGNIQEAKPYLEESRKLALEATHFNNAILSTSNLGTLTYLNEDYLQAAQYFAESIKLMRQSGDTAGLSHVMVLQAYAEAEFKTVQQVSDTLTNALIGRETATEAYSNMYLIMGASRLSMMQRDYPKAAKFYGVADQLGGENPFVREWLDPLKTRLEQQHNYDSLIASIEEGLSTAVETVITQVEELLQPQHTQ